MNIATNILSAPLEKQASIFDIATLAKEYLGSGGLTKLLPQGFAGNHALAAGAGALGSDATRRMLRSRGFGDATSSAIGSLMGLGVGGIEGGAGALAALHPAVRGRTASTGLKNILGTTSLLAGGEHLGKAVAGVNPSALVSEATGGVSKLVSPLTPSIASPVTINTGDGLGKLISSVGNKGVSEISSLKEQLAQRLGNLGTATTSELGNTDLYKTLGSIGLSTGAMGGGLHMLNPTLLNRLRGYVTNTPRAAAMGLGGLGLVAAGAPVLGAGTALAGIASSGATRDALKYLYGKAPGGSVPAAIGGSAAFLGAPVLGAGLGTGALLLNPAIRKGSIGAGQVAGKQLSRGYRALPKGSIMGGAGLGATVAGMPLLGIPTMLAAPFYNNRSSKFIGDVARELRAPVVKAREAQKTKEVIDGLYKKSSYSIKLAAPVYRTRPAYCLDAPTMDKVAFLPQMFEAGAKFLGKSQRALFGGNKAKLLDRSAKALQRGARESGTVLTPEQARRQAEAFFRQDANLGAEVVARNAPKRGTRAGYADIGTQYEGSVEAIEKQLNRGTEGKARFIPFRNMRVRAQNVRDIEKQMFERGRQGTAPSPLKASTEASTKAQAELTQAQQAAREAGKLYKDPTTGKLVRGAEGEALVAKGQAASEVSRLKAPIEAAQQDLSRAQDAALRARQDYFQRNFGIDAPTKTIEQLQEEIRVVDGYIRNGDVARIPNRRALQKQVDALEATQRAQGVTAQPGLKTTNVRKYLGQDATQLEQTYRQLQQNIAARGKGPTTAQKNQLELLEEYMQLTPGASTREVAAVGSPELTNAFNSLSNNQRGALGLKKNAGPDQIRQAFTDQIAQLEGLGRPLNQRESKLLNKLKAAEVDVAGPAEFSFIGEGQAGLRTRLQEIERNLQRKKDYGAVSTAEGAVEPLKAPLQSAQEALSPAQKKLDAARRNLEIQKQRSRQAGLNERNRQKALESAQKSEQATADLISTNIANPVKSKLDAPVLQAVAEGGAKPQVVEVLSARGLEGVAPGMEEQLRLLEAAGVDTAKLVNNAAKRSGLPKAVNRLNEASDKLVNEAVGKLKLSPEELEVVQNAARQLSARGEQLTAAELGTLVTNPNTNITNAFIELESLAASGGAGRASSEYAEAAKNLGEVFSGRGSSFSSQLSNEFSTAQQLAADSGYASMRSGLEAATAQPTGLKRLFTRNPQRALTGEDLQAIEAVEALTNARIRAMETAITGQGGNAALAQAARPQLYQASAAVARSGNPEVARAWARALQEPGSLAKSIENNTQLRALIEAEAPQLLKQNNKAFNLSVEQASELNKLIPKSGRGSAENIAKEVELAFKPETLRDTASPRAVETLEAMKSTTSDFGQRMQKLLESSNPAENSAVNKVLSGTTDISKLTIEEVAALEGVTTIVPNANRLTTNTARITAANKELAALKQNATIEESLSYLEKELKRLKTPRGGGTNPRRAALEDARDTILSQLKTSRKEFTTEYSTHMGESRKTLEKALKKDPNIDLAGLRRNTDLSKVKVERSTMDKLYQQPIMDESGNLAFNQADITKQLEHIKSLRGNANVPENIMQARVIEENLARLKDAGVTDQGILNNARANLERMFAPTNVEAVTQEGRRGGALAGALTLAGTGVGAGALSSRRRGGVATQARQQVTAAWGLSPLHAPVVQSKLASPIKPISVKSTEPKLPNLLKAPTQSPLTATPESLQSLLTAPVGGI